MLTFLFPWFAIAGAAAAAAPIVIHLLNRRRFRVVQWAAMDFLREAVTRSRRIMQLRDLLLLLLRVACLLVFGLALARPSARVRQAAVDPNQPVHAVVLVDNSLSMSYQPSTAYSLDDAKAKAKEFIEAAAQRQPDLGAADLRLGDRLQRRPATPPRRRRGGPGRDQAGRPRGPGPAPP